MSCVLCSTKLYNPRNYLNLYNQNEMNEIKTNYYNLDITYLKEF